MPQQWGRDLQPCTPNTSCADKAPVEGMATQPSQGLMGLLQCYAGTQSQSMLSGKASWNLRVQMYLRYIGRKALFRIPLIWIDLFCVNGCHAHTVTMEVRRGSGRPRNWSYRWLLDITWVLETEPGSCGRAVSALICRATSPALYSECPVPNTI